jgi:hypothetical protein
MRSSLVRMRSSLVRMRSSLVIIAPDCQCTSCNGPGFDPSILRQSGIWGAADEAVLNIVRKIKDKKSPQNIFKKKIVLSLWAKNVRQKQRQKLIQEVTTCTIVPVKSCWAYLHIKSCLFNNHLSIKKHFYLLGSTFADPFRIRRFADPDQQSRVRTQSTDLPARLKGIKLYTDQKLITGSGTDWVITDRIRNCAVMRKPDLLCSHLKGHCCKKER